ncbi:amidohydrolase family protein [Streptomyces sp. SHP 1-2]|uniref:amidohydrolase family protein n=1 Tax=Streptomyces sp. SHP 1-2 TaxID=2769489 RepID=UPI002238934B|nr:amidohydrolase family protein [Streptomyces sp. SHP 1-2]MCW5253196.1 amidohydrolase [Streptomyces sp. SHP 1-2]
MSADLVDVHRHTMPRTVLDFLRSRREPPFLDGGFVRCTPGFGYRLTPEMTDLAANLEEMAGAGVRTALLSVIVGIVDQLPAAQATALAKDVNDEMCDLARAHPGVLAPMSTLPLADPEAAAEELLRANGLGLRGPLLPVTVGGRQLGELGLDPLFEAADATGTPLTLHPTAPAFASHFGDYALMSTLAFPVDTTACVLRLVLGGLYERWPGIRMVVPHAGSLLPYLMGRIDREATKYRASGAMGALSEPPSVWLRRMYVDAISLWPPTIRLLLDVMGPDRVMFGSDYPFWNTRENAEALAAVTDDERIRAGNARTLYHLGAAP